MSEQQEVAQAPGTEMALADPVGKALSDVTSTKTSITEHLDKARELHERFKDVAFDVSTTKGYEEATKARAALREHRYAIQNLQPGVSKLLGSMQRNFNKWCETITGQIEADYEKPIHDQIVAEDQRKAREKEAREEDERKRRQAHAEAINAISKMALDAVGLGAEEIAAKLQAARDMIVDEGYEEFQGQAQQAKDEAVRQLNGMLMAARLEEQERQELEQERQRQAAYAAQQEEQRKQAEAQAAAERERAAAAEREAADLRARLAAAEERERELAAERERAARERSEAIQRRLDAIVTAGEPLEGRSLDELASIQRTVNGSMVTEDLFGERTAEAAAAVEQRVREITEAYQKEDAEVQKRLDGIARVMQTWTGEEAPPAILERLDALAEESYAWGPRASEAAALIQRADAHLREVHALALAREEAAARAARIQELIDNIRGMGESALLAVQDGSAEVEQLRANLQVLEGLDPLDFGEARHEEASTVIAQARERAREAIAQTEERDRLAAEEAARREQEEAEERAALQLVGRKQAHGEALYEMVRKFVMGTNSEWTLDARLDAEGRALLLRINPAEDFGSPDSRVERGLK